MDIVIAGSHGLVGTTLLAELRAHGHVVRRLVRSAAARPDEITWDPDAGVLAPSALEGADAVINLAGAGVADKRLTADRKRTVLLSRTRTTALLSTTLAGLDERPRVLLQASGIGAYGDRGDVELDESEPIGDSFFAGVVREWEASTRAAEDAGVRVAHLRTSIVLSRQGGALGRLLPLVRAGVGGPMGSGRQYWSWITLVDEVRAIEHLLDAPVHGPVNLVVGADTNAEITAALARALHRPAVLRVPAWALRLVLADFSQELLGSIRAVPRALTEAGFVPEHPDLASAVAYVTAR